MKRILLVNESSMILSGLGKIGKIIMTSLQKAGYEIAELSCGISPEANYEPGWKVYPNIPSKDNKDARAAFDRDPTAQYGSWNFENIVLDFRPDIVMCINDPHAMKFIVNSCLRRYYKTVMMPTIDSLPLKADWHATLLQSDHTVFYSDWARNNTDLGETVLRYPVSNVFEPGDKIISRISCGMPTDAYIYGTIFKNQPRKLINDLFKVMSKVLEDGEYLYLHTDYPGGANPWNIVDLINKYNMHSKVLLPYVCVSCSEHSVSCYQGDVRICPACRKYAMYTKNTAIKFKEEKLKDVICSLDMYVQFAEAEGACVPIGEAAMCGVKVCCPDGTAMQDYKYTINAKPLAYENIYHQKWESMRMSLGTDRNVDIIKKFKHEEVENLAEMAKAVYGEEVFAANLCKFMETVQVESDGWYSPKRDVAPIAETLDIEQLHEKMQELDMMSDYELCNIYSLFLNNPYKLPSPAIGVDTKNFIKYINSYINQINYYEEERCKLAHITTE